MMISSDEFDDKELQGYVIASDAEDDEDLDREEEDHVENCADDTDGSETGDSDDDDDDAEVLDHDEELYGEDGVEELYDDNDVSSSDDENDVEELDDAAELDDVEELYDENATVELDDEGDIEELYDENATVELDDEGDIEELYDEDATAELDDEGDVEELDDEDDVEELHDDNDDEEVDGESDVEEFDLSFDEAGSEEVNVENFEEEEDDTPGYDKTIEFDGGVEVEGGDSSGDEENFTVEDGYAGDDDDDEEAANYRHPLDFDEDEDYSGGDGIDGEERDVEEEVYVDRYGGDEEMDGFTDESEDEEKINLDRYGEGVVEEASDSSDEYEDCEEGAEGHFDGECFEEEGYYYDDVNDADKDGDEDRDCDEKIADNYFVPDEFYAEAEDWSEDDKRKLEEQAQLKLNFDRQVRRYLAEGLMQSYEKAELAAQLVNLNFDESGALHAAHECSNIEAAISYLQQECALCASKHSIKNMLSMLHCVHRCCQGCAKDYFTIQIRDKSIMDVVCPFCSEPDLENDDVAGDYFSHLDIMLKGILDVKIYELFQRKLRDRTLIKDPNFRWCNKCSSGFIINTNQRWVTCPDCKAETCAFCHKQWEKQHENISCEQFAAWKEANDPKTQALGVARYLKEHGITCPRCRFVYAMARGGCMHFTCSECKFEFCSGCGKPFCLGTQCGITFSCTKLGLHAHHPRNCLFYLRDKEPRELQMLLDAKNLVYDTLCPGEDDQVKDTDQQLAKALPVQKAKCQIQVDKETLRELKNDICGNEVEKGHAGLCRVHYIEYLGRLISKNKLDPLPIMSNDELEAIISRADKYLPGRSLNMTDAQYRDSLLKIIHKDIPLE